MFQVYFGTFIPVLWKMFIFSMFYHLEHHLFPAVPTIKLPELAKRIDEALPELEKKQTF
ncbi:Fatty acid desaturase [Filimonas lacunae]|uniref:Fatty acid desaturase n=1 Tax=Filimonas lacunae TaxID=477680 RepID=A0A1N7R2Q1_9BACT|nr:fatty acid desaturase [Filimonas lacunae]SIT28967.1 Fatty acid desaturase [Filimonas lacunae]